MSEDINQVLLCGRLGLDPILRFDADGTATAVLQIATERPVSADETYAEWHRAVCMGRDAAAADQRLRKGHRVTVRGWLRTREWEEGGETLRMTEVVVDELTFHEPE